MFVLRLGEGRSHSTVPTQLAKLLGGVDADGVPLKTGQGSAGRRDSSEGVKFGVGVTCS